MKPGWQTAVSAAAVVAAVAILESSFAAQLKTDFQDTGAVIDTRSDGSQVVIHPGPDHIRFIRYPTGYGGELKLDGTVVNDPMPRVEILRGGGVVLTLPDESKVEALPEGTRILRLPDKSGYTRYADGSGTKDFPDGSTVDSGPIQILPDGSVLKTMGETVFVEKTDGTTVGHFKGGALSTKTQKFSSAGAYLDDKRSLQQSDELIERLYFSDLMHKADADTAGTPRPSQEPEKQQAEEKKSVFESPFGFGFGIGIGGFGRGEKDRHESGGPWEIPPKKK